MQACLGMKVESKSTTISGFEKKHKAEKQTTGNVGQQQGMLANPLCRHHNSCTLQNNSGGAYVGFASRFKGVPDLSTAAVEWLGVPELGPFPLQ
jgi:hypothetical protein